MYIYAVIIQYCDYRRKADTKNFRDVEQLCANGMEASIGPRSGVKHTSKLPRRKMFL